MSPSNTCFAGPVMRRPVKHRGSLALRENPISSTSPEAT